MKFLQNQHLELQLSGSPFKGEDAGKPGDSKALAFGVSVGHGGIRVGPGMTQACSPEYEG